MNRKKNWHGNAIETQIEFMPYLTPLNLEPPRWSIIVISTIKSSYDVEIYQLNS